MQFLNPSWLFAAPAILGALVLLYFLKLKRREVTVSSTFLWHRALDELRVNSPLQRLRMNLLLFLQLAALGGLLLALARPLSAVGGLGGVDSILLIDVSASMRAHDAAGKTRFERAILQAERVVDDLSRRDRAIIIAFADDVRVLTDLTSSKALLRQALSSLRPTDRPTRLAPAVHRARTLLSQTTRRPRLLVFSDGRVGALTGVSLEKDVPLEFVAVGEAGANLGIVAVDVTQGAGLGESTRALASVQNTGRDPRTVGLDLSVDGELADSQELTVPPGGVVSASFDVSVFLEPGRARRLRFSLDGSKDPFPVDDEAWAILEQPEPIRVLLVSGGNLFLHSALSEDPRVWKTPLGDVPILAPEDFRPDDPSLRDHDVVVLDRFTPPELPPGNYLCFGARPPFPDVQDLGQAEDCRVLDWDESHPVTRFVNFANLVMPTMRVFKAGERQRVVVRGTHGPVVLDARDAGRRALVCAFDLMSFPVEGAWTFDPSFPIFLANAVRSLAGEGGVRRGGRLVRCGGTATLEVPAGAARALLTPPDGEPRPVSLSKEDDALRVPGLDRAGVYTVRFEDAAGELLEERLFAANLVDPDESRIEPAASIELVGRPPAPATTAAEGAGEELWKIAALLALAFVMVEWWIYNRRVFL
ncbi:MAG: VWA domain-containing protein [Planctomycetota bacterium]|nr:MAG: VWA domain-containing protein [Planctomycetota bacterium]